MRAIPRVLEWHRGCSGAGMTRLLVPVCLVALLGACSGEATSGPGGSGGGGSGGAGGGGAGGGGQGGDPVTCEPGTHLGASGACESTLAEWLDGPALANARD